MATRWTCIIILSLLIVQTLPISGDEVDEGPGPRVWIEDQMVRDLIQWTTDNMTEEYVYSKLENLTDFGTRYAHSVQNPKAAHWIYEHFVEYGYEVEKWNFTHQGNDKLSNVIATLPGTDPDGYIIVCAHLDSVNWPESWSFPETLAPGADDDGTGIAVLLQMAKVLSKYRFKQDIKFIAFNAEELTRAVGSTRYAENATANNDPILSVLNVDMIGYNDDHIKMDVIYRPSSYDLFTDHVFPVNMEFMFIDHLYDKQDPQSASSWGDVEPFWERGYRGLAFAESLYPRTNDTNYKANPNYHTENDTLDTINIELTNRGGMLVTGTLISLAEPTLPDVEIAKVAVPERMVFEDEEIDIRATMVNKGNFDAIEVEVDLTIDGVDVDGVSVDIPASGMDNVTFKWKAVPGDHVITISLDPLDKIGEWNDKNNNVTVTKFVQIRPDIELERFELLEGNMTQGEVTHLTVKAVNHGPTDMECNFTVIDSRSPGQPFATEFIQLDDGGEWEKVYEWSSLKNGTHYLTGQLSDFQPFDRNESNNMLMDSIEINGIPVARFFINPRVGGSTYQEILFLAESSSDDDTISEFHFDFGDGNDTGWTDQPSVTHNYTQDGVYTATLMVKDNVDAESSPVTMTVSIDNRAPIVKIEADRYVAETGAPITFSSKGTYDLDGDVDSYNWTFSPGPFYSSKPDPTMRFMEMGSVTARLMVVDDDGGVSSASITVDITNKPPDAAIEGPRTITKGETVQFTGAGSIDEDGHITKWYWNFGDGTISSETDPTHAYSKAGNYTVELTVTDNRGGKDKTTLKVLVTERPVTEIQELRLSDYYPLFVFLVLVSIYIVYDVSTTPRKPPKKMRW